MISIRISAKTSAEVSCNVRRTSEEGARYGAQHDSLIDVSCPLGVLICLSPIMTHRRADIPRPTTRPPATRLIQIDIYFDVTIGWTNCVTVFLSWIRFQISRPMRESGGRSLNSPQARSPVAYATDWSWRRTAIA